MGWFEDSEKLSRFIRSSNGSIFLHTEPEILDHTCKMEGRVILCNHRDVVDLIIKPSNVRTLIGFFNYNLFCPEIISRLYCWNLKSLASYCSYFSTSLDPQNKFFDLKVIENFCFGRCDKKPQNLQEFVIRLKECISSPSKFQLLYNSLHKKLILRIVPSIETTPLLNKEKRTVEFPCYEIEGQINGRMNCSKSFRYCYLPHNLSEQAKKKYYPYGYERLFCIADYRYCEVVGLWWLSKDVKLEKLLQYGDFYNNFFKFIFGIDCDNTNKRNVAKRIFLPVMYGCGAHTLAKSIGSSVSLAKQIIRKTKRAFETAYDYLMQFQEQARKGRCVVDYFGRSRLFHDDYYKARNFVVQSLAATVCQEHLVSLYERLPSSCYICFTKHDEYCVSVPSRNYQEYQNIVSDVLSEESKLCPGLKFSVSVSCKKNLSN